MSFSEDDHVVEQFVPDGDPIAITDEAFDDVGRPGTHRTKCRTCTCGRTFRSRGISSHDAVLFAPRPAGGPDPFAVKAALTFGYGLCDHLGERRRP